MATISGRDYHTSPRYTRGLSSNPARATSLPKGARSVPSREVETVTSHLANAGLRSPFAATPSFDIPRPHPTVGNENYHDENLVTKILESRAPDSSFSTLKVLPKVWDALCERVSEAVGAKLSYSADTQILVVTWPTATHESFKWTMKPLEEIANAFPSQLQSDTNIDIPNPNSTSITNPDFAFGKVGANRTTKYAIILECAFTQSTGSLEEKAEKHLMRPEVDKITWAPTIEKIELSVWNKIGGTLDPVHKQIWDITPIANDPQDHNLLQRHSEIVRHLRNITLVVVGRSTFDSFYKGGREFDINWQTFYSSLRRYLCFDAFKRYNIWFNQDTPKQVESKKRSFTSTNLYPDSDPDEPTDEATYMIFDQLIQSPVRDIRRLNSYIGMAEMASCPGVLDVS
ncbi:hypothetical protein C8R44DRAFT_887096 [Mycena epipterygia]|nr:hypothetical protein C8R44DRAFT_887096 [Mycena epipterygia]